MIRNLIRWAVNSRLVVLLCAVALMAFGGYSFINVNVEAYPDPAPAIIEIISQYPGGSAEEVERQVTIPLEVSRSRNEYCSRPSAMPLEGDGFV